MPPIAKVTLAIAAVGEHEFRLELRENVRKAPEAPVMPPELTSGKFTSLVALGRKKRPRRRWPEEQA